MDPLPLILLGAAIAGFVQGLSGFAFGLVAMVFWVWAVPPETAGPLVVACSLLGQSLSIRAAWRGFEPKRALPFIAGGLLGVPIGAWLLPHIAPDTFKRALGLFLVVWCPTMLLAKNLPHIAWGGRPADAAAGWLGGVMGGLGGFSGPAPTLWCSLRGWDKHTQRAMFQSFHLCMHSLTLTLYATGGLITGETLHMFALAAPAMILPTILGALLYGRISDHGFRRLVLTLLLISGAFLLASTWH
jgi:hypothetical protein